VAAAKDRVGLVVRLPDGDLNSVVVWAHPPDPLPEGIEALIPPSRAMLISRENPCPNEPLYLQSPSVPFRWELLAGGAVAYLQFRANKDFDGPLDIEQFSAETEARLRTLRPRYIVLDERDNWGGDLTTTRGLVKALPDIVGPHGRVFILTSGRTFSAGIASAAYAKQAAPDRTVIIGEPVGDNLEFWAEGDLVELPNSGTQLLYAKERHNYRTGCPEPDCHPPIREDPIRIDTLVDVRGLCGTS
jgi:hypothetical protein